MDKEIYNVNEALVLLKEGVILKDINRAKFVYRKDRVQIYCLNSSYNLTTKDFLTLYKDNEFIVDANDEDGIDSKKDEEYYNFKHK